MFGGCDLEGGLLWNVMEFMIGVIIFDGSISLERYVKVLVFSGLKYFSLVLI